MSLANRYSFLRDKSMLKLLVAMYETGKKRLSELGKEIDSMSGAYRAASKLAILGLVRLYHCETPDGNRLVKCAELTPSGEKVAKKIKEVLETLEETLNERGQDNNKH